jgi:hypothetical protein
MTVSSTTYRVSAQKLTDAFHLVCHGPFLKSLKVNTKEFDESLSKNGADCEPSSDAFILKEGKVEKKELISAFSHLQSTGDTWKIYEDEGNLVTIVR